MNNTIKLETLLTGIAAFLLLALLVTMPIDIVDFYDDKQTYAMVYHLDMNEKNWEWEYLSGWAYMGVLIIVGLTIVALRLIKKNNKTIRKLNWIFLILFFGSMIFGFYDWMRTGFDH
jgi:hypothetical protein